MSLYLLRFFNKLIHMVSVILSGGENRRFPAPKGFIEVEGVRIIERTLTLLKRATGRVVISANEPEKYFYLGAPLIGDVVKSSGPIGGIISAFLGTGADEILVAACDMPFIRPDIIKYIMEKRGGQATVPVHNGEPEPLLAVYSRAAFGPMEGMARKGQRSLKEMLGGLAVRYIDEAEIRGMDPEGKSFVNINTPADFDRAFGKRREALN